MRDEWGSPDEERREAAALHGARLRYAAARAERDMRLRDEERTRKQHRAAVHALRAAEAELAKAREELEQ